MTENIKVCFLYADDTPWKRQFLTEEYKIGNVNFSILKKFDNKNDYDFIVVYGDFQKKFSPNISKDRIIFIAPEPPSVIKYPEEFLNQFGLLITPDRETPHPNKIFYQQGLPWHVGMFATRKKLRKNPTTAKEFLSSFPKKDKLVSVICSSKVFTSQHQSRHDFVEKLKKHFGDKIDFFGRGSNEFIDKEAVIAPYRYHIALENSDYTDYWTEKISDPILLLSYPIYYGCSNLDDYLPSDCFTRIDINKPEQAIKTIEEIISSDLDKERHQALIRAREKIVNEQSTFPIISKIVNDLIAKAENNIVSAEVMPTLLIPHHVINFKLQMATKSLGNKVYYFTKKKILNPKQQIKKIRKLFSNL